MKVVVGFTYAWFAWKSSETNISSAGGTASINLSTNSFMLYDGVTNAFDRDQNMLVYQVVRLDNDVETPIDGCSGYINSGSTLSLWEVDLSHTPTTYKVYLYLDCNTTTTTTLIGSTYSGYIGSVAYLDAY